MGSDPTVWSWQRFSRPLAVWLGSFVAAATVLLVYWRIPLGPLLIGGGVTLFATVLRVMMSRRAHPRA